MSQRIQHKKTSIPGKRPSELYLEPGEIALNTSSSDPGLYVELSNGDIGKVGPTYLGPNPPQSEVGYGPGEEWLNTNTNSVNIWVPALNKWVKTLTPWCGGSSTVVFVGSEYPEATDNINNDGSTRPFATLNRAVLEIAKRSILLGDVEDKNRYTIFLLPGSNVVINDPGLSFLEFEKQISLFQENSEITTQILKQFNPTSGGLLIPRGTSIVGLDLRKTLVSPTYYPFWSRLLYESEPELISNRTSILKWTGNCYLNSFTFRDKNNKVSVSRILPGNDDQPAVLVSSRPHGFRSEGDIISLKYSPNVSRVYKNQPTIFEGDFFVESITPNTFYLKTVTGEYVLRSQLPESNSTEILSLELSLTSHHRLTSIEFAKVSELNEFYSKVQTAFSNLDFSNRVSNTEVTKGEVEIVSQASDRPSSSLSTVSNSSPYVFNVCVRSNYGLGGLLVDGDSVGGLKSALACNLTSVSLQNDPDVFEVYSNGEWISLKKLYNTSYNSEATDEEIMDFLVDKISLENIRYFFRDNLDIPTNSQKSSGLVDERSDTRHFSILCSNRGFIQCVSSMAIGLAVNYWTKNGGTINISNANSTFGGVAIRSEGFNGIGTPGGAETMDKGFTIQGIRRPKSISQKDVVNSIQRFYLNARLISATSESLTFDSEIDPTVLYPFSLKPDSAIWVEDYLTGDVFQATLRSTYPVISSDRKRIFVKSLGNSFFDGEGLVSQTLDLPYIRRFVDPREERDQVYSLWIKNTSPDHRPPQVGSILRFAEKPGENVSNLLKVGVQLDPKTNGGWGHLFQVISVFAKEEGDNPNKVNPLFRDSKGQDYYVAISPVDYFHPWVPSGNNGFSVGDFYYAEGSLITFRERIQTAVFSDILISSQKLLPEDNNSVWVYTLTQEYCQPAERAWFSNSSELAGDNLSGLYSDSSISYTYPRGLGYNMNKLRINNFYDQDNGSESLGVLSNPLLVDPWWFPTKLGMSRFLTLLGFSYEQLNTLLQPQLPWSRVLSVGSMPPVSGKGYALSTGTWPVEFNQPSTILCNNHSWEWCGYLNYGKGLPKYQTGELTPQQRNDFLYSEVWGGKVFASGTTEQGKFILTQKS